MVTWHSSDQDGDSLGVFGQRYDATGASIGSEFQINTFTLGPQYYPSVAPLSNGGFVVTWQSYGQTGSGHKVFGQRYDASGASVGSEFQVNTHISNNQHEASVAALSDGGFVVTWSIFY